MRLKISITFLIILTIHLFCYAEETKDESSVTSSFNQAWLKTVVSIEIKNEKEEISSIGTGFIVRSPENHGLLITAKHVIVNSNNKSVKIKENLAYRLNDREKDSAVYFDKELEEKGLGSWFISKEYDVACRFIERKKTSDVKTLTLGNFVYQKNIQTGAPLIILGFPLGLRSEEYAKPIARKAMVARSDTNNIIVDGFVFPGNSGGPVVYVPTLKLGKGLKSNLLNEQHLVGLVSSSINYREPCISVKTQRLRITFEDNTGLTKIVPSDAIAKLINREDVMVLDKKLKELKKKLQSD